MVLTWGIAVPAKGRVEEEGGGPQVLPPSCLRAPYAMPGTEIEGCLPGTSKSDSRCSRCGAL
eukprot:141352-Rhodomonas_salina.5